MNGSPWLSLRLGRIVACSVALVSAAGSGFWLRGRLTPRNQPAMASALDLSSKGPSNTGGEKAVDQTRFTGFQGAEVRTVASIKGKRWCQGRFGSLGMVVVTSEPDVQTSFRFPQVNLFLYKPVKGGFKKELLNSFDAKERSDGTGALVDAFFADVDGSGLPALVLVLACSERQYFNQGEGGYGGTSSRRAVLVYRAKDNSVQESNATDAVPFSPTIWCKDNQEEEEEGIVAAKERYYLRQFERGNLRVLLRNHFPLR